MLVCWGLVGVGGSGGNAVDSVTGRILGTACDSTGGPVMEELGASQMMVAGSSYRLEATSPSAFPPLSLQQRRLVSHATSCQPVLSRLAAACTQLATSLEQLTWLDMSRVTAISFQGVQGFAALQHLDISRCESLNTGAVTTALESFE
jgi:hypothetical protein